MSSRAIIALGLGQCVNWGVLYYAFGVLLIPVARDLGVAHWVVAGAFSTALFLSAAVAPTVGRWSDGGLGLPLIRSGGLAAGALLVLWVLVPGLPTLYLIWGAMGLCMAATLYEPAFVIIGRTLTEPAARLRALALVTVFGGLASTVFQPLTAVLIEVWGWRAAVIALASILALAACLTFRMAPEPLRPSGAAHTSAVADETSRLDPIFGRVLGVFAVASLASAAFTTTVVPALVERELPLPTAATLGGLFGVMQLPGRLLLMNRAFTGSPSNLVVSSLVLQAAGFATLALAHALPLMVAGIAVFGVGSGLMTLIRPHLVHTAFGAARAGYRNGILVRYQQLARAAGPVLAVGLASVVGFGALFGVFAGVMVAMAVTWRVWVNVGHIA